MIRFERTGLPTTCEPSWKESEGVAYPVKDIEECLRLAVELARRAGDLTLQWFQRDDLVIDTKGDGTPVTQADRAAERFLRGELAERFPRDGILGEEDGEDAGQSGRRWIIDPIDGTKPFTHGVPLYSNLLALLDDDGPAVGVINLPALGLTVAAGRGLGCFANGERVAVSDRPDGGLAGAMIMTSGIETWSSPQIEALQGAGGRLRTWGDAYGYALVAMGRVDAMVDPIAALWDLAPMPVILAEAGGHFRNVNGDDDPAGGNGIGASSRRVAEELSRILQR